MLPLIPFIAGAAAGVAATELWRRGKVQSAVQAASGKLRASAASGLESVRQSSANLRETVADALHDKWQALRGGKHGQEQAGQAQPAAIPALPAPEDQARQPAKADKAARPGARKPRAAGKRAAKPAASAAEASAPEAVSEPARAAKPARRRPPRKKAAAPDSAAE